MITTKPTLDMPVAKVYLVGPAYARRLEKLGIKTARDLLYHLPFRYEDYSIFAKANSLQEGEVVTIEGKVQAVKNEYTRGGLILQRALIEDETGVAEAIWFNQRFLTRAIRKNDLVSLSGKVRRNGKRFQLESPQFEVIRPNSETIHTGRIVPIYPETAGVSSKWLRSRIHALLVEIERGTLLMVEFLGEDTLVENGFLDLKEAIREVHFPTTLDKAAKAKERLAFNELLISQLASLERRAEQMRTAVGNKFKIVEIRADLKRLVDKLPFELTSAQKNAVNEIYKDLSLPRPMNRLLQGDVGSGKTVVAALAMLAAYLNGYQSVLMAPTEILAKQHLETLSRLLKPLNIGVGIATHSLKDYAKYDVVVGTHALLSDKLDFPKLGLVVIDEQHRFGVSQRAKLAAKGVNPHVLTMTATPIPRTVALTLYGDLDMSILDEMPKDRLPVRTWVVPAMKREAAYHWIRELKSQTFIICPLIEESETTQAVRSAKSEYEKLQHDVFPDLKLGLIHGKLSLKEKDLVLGKFRAGELDILVATPVVEVGIDIPNATIMVIEGADRFGLAQLHQLRGRVGRGSIQSYCLLFSDVEEATGRLKYLEKLNNGLALSEIDLKFRGPGERFGAAQHGRWDLKIADFSNLALIEKSYSLAQYVAKHKEKFPFLREVIEASKIEIALN